MILLATTEDVIADTDGTYVLFDNKLGKSVVIEGEYRDLLDLLIT